jgi:arylsulfatase A-like enzyme
VKPNFIFILSDDHHYRCFGAAGNPSIRTPNLDRLAARGVHFENGSISTAQCAPSRGVLLSGVETYQSGLRSNGKTTFDTNFNPSVIEMFRRQGYRTGLVGKWHIKPPPESLGFSEAPAWFPEGSMRYLDPRLRMGLQDASEPRTGHVNELLTNAGIGFIRQKDKPFFLWMSYNAPHTPWHAPPEYLDRHRDAQPPPGHPPSAKKFDWQTYYAVISHLDFHIGRLLDELDRSGQADNTYVVFLGDNGYLCGAKGLNGKVHPWEPSLRVPFLFAGPGVQKGAVSEAMATSVDLPATWLELAGINPDRPLAGRSLVKELRTGRGGPSEGFSVWDDGRVGALAIRVAVQPYRTVRKGEHKLILWNDGREALFNVVQDPAEENDFVKSPSSTGVLKDLRAALRRRMKQTNDPALTWPG